MRRLVSYLSLSLVCLLASPALPQTLPANQVPDRIQGTVQINGDFYTTLCDCNPELQGEAFKECQASQLKLTEDKAGTGASFDDIRQFLGRFNELQIVKVLDTSFSCLDGRNNEPSLSTPGGDAGEFILGLAVYEDLAGRQLANEEIKGFLQEYLLWTPQPHFVLCTDDEAVTHLGNQLEIEGVNLNGPREGMRQQLLQALTEPENIGDLHVKLMLKHPDRYMIRKQLVTGFVQAFFETLWDPNHPKPKLKQLQGSHQEVAFLELRENDSCAQAKQAPLLKQKKAEVQAFVNHLDAASQKRFQLASYFTDVMGHHHDGVDRDRMHNRLNHHGLAYLEVTGSFIAKDLPFFTASMQ